MGLTYHFSFTAPAAVTAEELEEFLQNVEGDAKLLGFEPTVVINGPFDTPERREFAKRTARGLVVEEDRLRGIKPAPNACWSCSETGGFWRLAPAHGVLLVVTDAARRETVFGFFRYPRKIVDRNGREIMDVPGDGAWVSGNFVNSPDHRYRALARRFAEAGYLQSELDEFVRAGQTKG